MPHDQRDAVHARREVGHAFGAAREEIVAQQQVFRRITAHGELRRHHHVRTGCSRAFGKIDDLRNVSGQVSDRRVHLRNRNFHDPNITSRSMTFEHWMHYHRGRAGDA
jgi:hypothetical protein